MANEFENGFQYRLARVEQRVADLDQRLTVMTPLVSTVVQLTERMETLRRDLQSYTTQVGRLEAELAAREQATRKERRQATIAMATLAMMIVCALIPAITVLLTHH